MTEGKKIENEDIAEGKRINIDYAGVWKDKLWRFTIKGNPYISVWIFSVFCCILYFCGNIILILLIIKPIQKNKCFIITNIILLLIKIEY